jgi:hypothetical protein
MGIAGGLWSVKPQPFWLFLGAAVGAQWELPGAVGARWELLETVAGRNQSYAGLVCARR